jgi:lambda family phage tail tape measure protein
MSIVDGTKSVADAFKAMAADIVAHLFKVLVVQSAIRNMGGMMAMAGGPMGAIGGALMSYGSADGNVFNNGNAVPYADGGVVNVPTYFPMNDGRTGLMGEAGPEAIMPLRRGKNGKLGVQVEGGRGDVIIHQSFNFQANGDESVKKIIAQQAPAIANMTKSKILEDRRRGGQTRQAFG